MPYNTTPITPAQEITGTVSLPLARVKKIIHADEDIGNCSNNAAFAIAVATEMFIQHLAEQTHNVVKSERRPRRNIQYKDVANAVARIDNLEFLADVVPRTTTYRAHKEKRDKKAEGTLSTGQRTMEQMTRPAGADDASAYDFVDTAGSNGQVHAPHTIGDAYISDGERADSPEPSHAQEPNRAAAVQARHTYDAVHDVQTTSEMAMEE